MSRRSTESSKTMADFKHLSYYDQLREIERHLVKLQDSYRRIPSVPQSQPMDLISDLLANPPNFQSIEPIEVDETNLGSVYIEVLGTPSSMQEIVGVSQDKENEQLGQIVGVSESTFFPSEILAFHPLVVNTTGMVSCKPLVSNFEENSKKLKKQEEDQGLIEELPMSNPEQFTDMVGSTRNFPGDLLQESRGISSSLEIKFKEGNNRTLDFPMINLEIVISECVFEGMGEVVDAPVEPVGFNWGVVKMSRIENLGIHSAHHVFVKLFEEQLADVNHFVALSIEYPW